MPEIGINPLACHLVHKLTKFVTRFAKTQRKMMHFGSSGLCISEFHIPKALFCSNVYAVLQIAFELQG